MPNPYVIQGTLPSTSLWFMVLDLKDAFFFIPLAQQSQFLFAFEWEPPVGPPNNLSGQYSHNDSGIAPTSLAKPSLRIYKTYNLRKELSL